MKKLAATVIIIPLIAGCYDQSRWDSLNAELKAQSQRASEEYAQSWNKCAKAPAMSDTEKMCDYMSEQCNNFRAAVMAQGNDPVVEWRYLEAKDRAEPM